MRSIGVCTRFLLVVLAIPLSTLLAQSQIYTQQKQCIVDFTPPGGGTGGGGVGGGTGGGTGTGGAAAAPEGCPKPSYFFDKDTAATSWRWDMGDGNSYNTRAVNHFYTVPGNYQVTLTRGKFINGLPTAQTEIVNIEVGNYPQQPRFNGMLQADTTVCGDDLRLNPFRLNLPIGNYAYLWYPGGDTTSTITVDSSGCYSVEVTDLNTGCSRTASINVNFCLRPSGAGGGPEEWYFGEGGTLLIGQDGGEELERDSLASDGSLYSEPEIDPTTVTFSAVDNEPPNALSASGATAMVYGPSGALAFYTDGVNIFNGNDELVTDLNGNSLINADTTTSQGLLIIPKSSCAECPHHQYEIIYIDNDTKILSKATIDLRLNEGAGAIVDVGVPLAYPVADRINATITDQEDGFIVFSLEENSNLINITVVDSSGVSTISTPGANPRDTGTQEGYLAVNADGSRIAFGTVRNGNNFIEVYEFDKVGLSLQNPITIQLPFGAPPEVYGVEFSENGDFLYVTLRGDPNNGETSYLLQIPILLVSPSAIESNIIVIDESTTEAFGALKAGPVGGRGKSIYMAIDGSDEIPYIQQPDIRGDALAIGYTRVPGSARTGVEISGISRFGFPNVIFASPQQSGDGIQATYSGNCFNASTLLSVEDVCSPLRNEVQWVMPDGTVLKGSEVSHTFGEVGWNNIVLNIRVYKTSPLRGLVNNQVVNQVIELTETVCQDTTIIDSIYIKPSPIINFPDSVLLCPEEFISSTLDPQVEGGPPFTYNWYLNTGVSISSDSVYQAIAPAIYNVDVQNDFQCESTGSVKVVEGCLPRLYVGEAITPNGDNINDSFKIEYRFIEDFRILIYSRWGELVFESDEPDVQWDGTVNGRVMSPSLYAYIITYRSRDFPEMGIIEERGAIWVFK